MRGCRYPETLKGLELSALCGRLLLLLPERGNCLLADDGLRAGEHIVRDRLVAKHRLNDLVGDLGLADATQSCDDPRGGWDRRESHPVLLQPIHPGVAGASPVAQMNQRRSDENHDADDGPSLPHKHRVHAEQGDDGVLHQPLLDALGAGECRERDDEGSHKGGEGDRTHHRQDVLDVLERRLVSHHDTGQVGNDVPEHFSISPPLDC